MEIRKFRAVDFIESADLVHKTYKKFNNKEGSKRAVQAYLDLYDSKKNLKKVKEMFLNDPISFVCSNKGKIVGIVRGNKNRIWNLYVDGNYHGSGIGRKLMDAFEKEAITQGSKFINIRSSLYATAFYQKRGYKKTTGVRASPRLFYLKYQPMVKEFRK